VSTSPSQTSSAPDSKTTVISRSASVNTQRRIEALVDPESFNEFGSQVRHRTTAFDMMQRRPSGDGVVTGYATVDGRPIGVLAQDPSALGGSLGEMHAAKITGLLGYAERARTPVVGLLDSGGARIQEGIAALDGYGTVFRANVRLSGRVPQISVILGPCAGGAVYSPALTDIVIIRREGAHMFLTGPRVVQAVTFEDVTPDELGGAKMHSQESGVAHLVAQSDTDALDLARKVLSYLPSSCWDRPPMAVPADPEPMPSLPSNHRQSYDVRSVIRGVVDAGSFFELQARFARNLVVGLARVAGNAVGVVANQPQALAGVLDIASAEKGARFVRMCDAFGLPLVTFVDTPGFLPGVRQEANGVIRKGAKLLYAFAEATVPRITLVLRKAFGGAYIVMNSKSLGADAVFSWPDTHMAVMGAEGAVDVIFRSALQEAPERRAELIETYQREAMSPTLAAERLSVDEIIEPSETRHAVVSMLRALERAALPKFRHDNLPQ